MLPDETQITGQIKKAYTAAFKVHSSRVTFNRLFHKAFFTAKKIRTETAFGIILFRTEAGKGVHKFDDSMQLDILRKFFNLDPDV